MLYSIQDPRVLGAEESNGHDKYDYIGLTLIHGISMYAHGNLQTFLDFDILCTDEVRTYSQLIELRYNKSSPEILEYSTQAQNENGDIVDVIIYAWKVPGYLPDQVLAKGLVVQRDDERSIRHAKRSMENRRRFI